jgi:hypothetical protein
MKVKPPKVGPEAWGDNALKVTPTKLQKGEHEKKGNWKEQVCQPKDMALCIDPRRYYIRIKKHKEETISIDRG